MLLLLSIIGDGECDIDLTSTAAADIFVVFNFDDVAEDEAGVDAVADFLLLIALISPWWTTLVLMILLPTELF